MPDPDKLFATPWTVIENPESYCVADAGSRPLAYVYFEDERVRQSSTRRMSKEHARRLAAAIAKLPERLAQSDV
jgi:hypothetical protein